MREKDMNMAMILCGTLVSLLALGVAAQADEGEGPGKRCREKAKERFQALDQNGDGKLSADEAAGAPLLARRFADLDQDKDGAITPAEIKAALKEKMEKKGHERFAALDKDGDGKLSAAETASAPLLGRGFSRIDNDGDGFVTEDEIKQALKGRREKQRQRGEGGAHAGPQTGPAVR
jgi:Ca2+-binding EF-hand superfamily protein